MPVTEDDLLSPEPGSARRVMADLVAESFPPEGTIFRGLGGRSYTGAEMREEILRGTEVGRSYASTTLRVVRDLLARQAAREAAAEAADEAPSPRGP